MKLIGYTLGVTKDEQREQKGDLLDQFPDAKVYSESCSRNGRGVGAPTRQTRGHALLAVKNGDVFVTDWIERLGADEAETTAICRALLEEGVHIISTKDRIDTRRGNELVEILSAKMANLKLSKAKTASILADARKRGKATLRNTFTAEEQDMIRDLLGSGMRPEEIAPLFKVKESVINRTRSALGLTKGIYRLRRRPMDPAQLASMEAARKRVLDHVEAKEQARADARAQKAASIPPVLTDEDDLKIRELIGSGKAPKEIAPLLKVNVTTIRAACRRMELGVDKRFKDGKAGRKVTADMRPELLRRRNAGESVKALAEEIGVPKARVIRALVLERELQGKKAIRRQRVTRTSSLAT